MVITVKGIDIAVYVRTFLKSLKDIKQSDRIRTSGQTDNNNATVKESSVFGKFKDLI